MIGVQVDDKICASTSSLSTENMWLQNEIPDNRKLLMKETAVKFNGVDGRKPPVTIK